MTRPQGHPSSDSGSSESVSGEVLSGRSKERIREHPIGKGIHSWGLQDRTGEQSKAQASSKQTKHEGNGRGLPVDEPEATMTDTRTSWLMTANRKASKQSNPGNWNPVN